MRIVHVLTRCMRAGSEENTFVSCLAQMNGGHDVTVVHGEEYDPSYRAAVAARGLRIITAAELRHPLTPVGDARAVVALARLFRELSPDLVHTHQSKAGIVGRLAARVAGVPHVIHSVHILPFVNVGPAQRALYLAAERFVARYTHAFISVSRGMRDECVAAGVGRPEQHFIAHSGFDLDRFRDAEPPEDWRTLLGLAPDEPKPPVLLMLAAFEPRKRHVAFLAELHRVVARYPSVRVLLAGDGPARPEVEAACGSSGLEANVKLLGHSPIPERLIALADVCLLTSAREGLPRAVLQYLAAGRPAIVTSVPGLDEIIDDGRNGIVTNPEDLSQTADAVVSLLDDPARRAAIADAARATDLSSWSEAAMCRKIDEVYASVTGAKP